jgi:hypothetical protein
LPQAPQPLGQVASARNGRAIKQHHGGWKSLWRSACSTAVQRRWLDKLVGSWPLPRGTSVTKTTWNGVPVEVVMADQARPRTRSDNTGQATGSGRGTSVITVVHFHGGGYCVGSPAEARDWP